MSRLLAAACGPALAAALALCAAPAGAAVSLERVVKLRQPIQVAAVPGQPRLMAVVERRGVVRLLRDGHLQRRPLLDLSKRVDMPSSDLATDHGGLLSVAFAPDYPRSHRLYVFYTARDRSLRVEELTRGRARRTVLKLPGRTRYDLGGQIAFGPGRLLFVGLGYQEAADAPQDLGDLRGKMLRIDPRAFGSAPYRTPRTNPFAGRPGARREIWALGLRNPFRFSFAPGGSLVLGDVGQSRYEEVDVVPPSRAGANLGWTAFEGLHRTSAPAAGGSLLGPVIEHRHARGFCAVTGGLVVRDRSLSIRGRYLYSDFCLGRLRSAALSARGARGDREERPYVPHPVAFGEDAHRHVWVVSLDGFVYRVVPAPG
jgi:glucose/arabinose dehydrogenase